MPDLSDLKAEAEAGLLDFFDLDAWQDAPEQPVVNQLLRSRPGQVEVWMRNPHNWRPACEENPFPRYVFWQTDVARRNLRPYYLLRRLLPPTFGFRWMVVHGTHADLFDSCDDEPEVATRVPVWKHGDDPANLLRLCNAYDTRRWPMIVVGNLKRNVPVSRVETQRMNEWLHRVAASYPHVHFHLTGSNSFSQMFGLNFASVDYDPANNVQMGMVRLPNGRSVSAMRTSKHLKWVHVLGYSGELLRTDHFSRVGFNMRSGLWAAEHWNDTDKLKPSHRDRRADPLGLLGEKRAPIARAKPVNATIRAIYRTAAPDPDAYPQFSPDPHEPYAYAEPVTNAPHVPIRPRVKDSGDQILCNFCSLADSCRFYREDSVCGMPDTPGNELATMFATRNVDTIREALGRVLSNQTERYERARKRFKDDNESDVFDLKRSEHLMKMENSLVRSGEALVKLLDPSFRQSNIPAVVSSTAHYYNPSILVADVVRQMEAAGIPRAEINPAQILDMAKAKGMIEGSPTPSPAAQVLDGEIS